MPRLFLVAVILAALTNASWAAHAGQAPPTSYDTFMQLPREERTARFPEFSPDDRAAIVKTQAERWLRKNRGQLTAAQAAIIEDNIRFISPARSPAEAGHYVRPTECAVLRLPRQPHDRARLWRRR